MSQHEASKDFKDDDEQQPQLQIFELDGHDGEKDDSSTASSGNLPQVDAQSSQLKSDDQDLSENKRKLPSASSLSVGELENNSDGPCVSARLASSEAQSEIEVPRDLGSLSNREEEICSDLESALVPNKIQSERQILEAVQCGVTSTTKPLSVETPATEDDKQEGDTKNPKMAIFYFAMFCLLRSITYVVVDTLYERQPDMSPWQMFFMRSCMGIGIMSLHLNRRIKKETWDSIECRKSGPLAFKTVGGILTNLIQFSVTKFIPATIISIVANLAPIVVLILAFSFLKEKILKFDVAMIVLTLVGIFTIILGGDDENSDKATPNFPIWVIYIVLFFNPFLSAGGTVAMRKMAKSSDAVVSWYLQWGTLIASVCIILAMGESFSIYSAFEFWDWILAFFTGFLSIYSETVRFKALKMHDASALQKLIPLTTMFQWVFDISIFSIHYTWIQDIGLAYLMLIYIFQGFKYACESRNKKKVGAGASDLENNLRHSPSPKESNASQPSEQSQTIKQTQSGPVAQQC